jgi:GT2 family glycosyltransferase
MPVTEAVPLLTVAVLSYNGRHLLEVILPSLACQRFREFEVVVVDNGSSDGTCLWLKENWPDVQVVSLSNNVGVSAALNVCISVGSGRLLALFNNDMELDPDCLYELVHTFRKHPEMDWAGAKLMDYRHRNVVDGAGDVYTWQGVAQRRGHGELDQGQYDEGRVIFGACGGAAMYRRSVFRSVGAFDEDFFAFYEDVDWNLRANLAGFSCRYVPTAVVYHMGSATIGRGLTDFTRYQLWRNALWIIVKDLPAATLIHHWRDLARGQRIGLLEARRDQKIGIWLRSWRDALLALPRVLAKRRAVQRKRRINAPDLDALVGVGDGARDSLDATPLPQKQQ